MPFRDFFEKPTIADLALLVSTCLTAEIDTKTLAKNLNDLE